ncbi:hypothetical protein C7444_12012 [Sphaerotilus hippei]|uniref:NnrS family protein n=1 Tax=Sphaerotilus hippei TaxID=744406 RepID=A0A318GXU7_9BURK|nr:hypothetical protein [Sphaerotilus hippei]PXW93360.1 hypothetical protein C7444_12012 [Sphaerotilus hippei]
MVNERAPLPRAAVAAVVLLAMLNLLGALGGGLVRLGTLPPALHGPGGAQAVAAHGAVMMAGFFGALIALERAVALRRGLWVPALAGLGGLLAWGFGAWSVAQVSWSASAAGLLGLYAWAAWHRAASLPLAVEASGALALLVGTLGFGAGQPMLARLGWSAFLVLTIAGERRELMQMVRLPRWSEHGFVVGWALLAVAAGLLLAGREPAGLALWWALLAALAAWLLRWDLPSRQWRARGWAGHTALCLSTGYLWLLGAALLGLAGQAVAWHVLWLGFVMAMVFGHAPIMLPALAGWRPLPTRWALLPLPVLGLSLLLRITAPLADRPALLPWAGAGHALALVVFALVMGVSVRRGQAARRRR